MEEIKIIAISKAGDVIRIYQNDTLNYIKITGNGETPNIKADGETKKITLSSGTYSKNLFSLINLIEDILNKGNEFDITLLLKMRGWDIKP